MPYYGYGIDMYYLLLVLPALLVAMWAQHKVKGTFRAYSEQRVESGLTGAQAARRILDENGLEAIRIERVGGELTDHYDPQEGVIRLSASVYDRATASAVGVAAHEAGHAVQYAVGYAPIKLRSAIIPLSNIGSTLSMPLVLLGFILGFQPLVIIGIGLFSLVTVFQLVTLPVEFNASRRAERILAGSGMVTDEEQAGVHKVLSAAAFTYVAALLVSLMNLLRLVLLFRRRGND